MEILQPEEWAKPRGYNSGLKAKGSFVVLAGQVGWNRKPSIRNEHHCRTGWSSLEAHHQAGQGSQAAARSILCA